jgi:hypothetical protein
LPDGKYKIAVRLLWQLPEVRGSKQKAGVCSMRSIGDNARRWLHF